MKWRRQEPRGRFVVDFFCPEAALVVEVDGGVHDQFGQERDAARDAELEAAGWRVLRVSNAAVFDDLDGVLQTILFACGARPLTPAPLPASGERGDRSERTHA